MSLVYLDEFALCPPPPPLNHSSITSNSGKCIVTSTPNSDDDISIIWYEAIREVDDCGNESEVVLIQFACKLARAPRQRRVMGKPNAVELRRKV